MKFLELEEFLKIYRRSPADNLTVDEFIKVATVVIGKKSYSLNDYMQSKNIDKNKIGILLKNIQSRKEYLTRFYNMSLRLYNKNMYIHGNIKPMKENHMDNNTGTIYKNLIKHSKVHALACSARFKSYKGTLKNFLI